MEFWQQNFSNWGLYPQNRWHILFVSLTFMRFVCICVCCGGCMRDCGVGPSDSPGLRAHTCIHMLSQYPPPVGAEFESCFCPSSLLLPSLSLTLRRHGCSSGTMLLPKRLLCVRSQIDKSDSDSLCLWLYKGAAQHEERVCTGSCFV